MLILRLADYIATKEVLSMKKLFIYLSVLSIILSPTHTAFHSSSKLDANNKIANFSPNNEEEPGPYPDKYT